MQQLFNPVFYILGKGDTHVWVYDKNLEHVKYNFKDNDEATWFCENTLKDHGVVSKDDYDLSKLEPEDNTGNNNEEDCTF